MQPFEGVDDDAGALRVGISIGCQNQVSPAQLVRQFEKAEAGECTRSARQRLMRHPQLPTMIRQEGE